MAPNINATTIAVNLTSTESSVPIVNVTTTVATALNSTIPFNATTSNVTTITTTTPWWVYQPVYTTPAPQYDYYWYYWDYTFYVMLILIFVLIMPLLLIKMSLRKRQMAARAQAMQRQQARRQVEININNGTSVNNSNPSNTENDISILPKGYDLPPAYDEVVINSKQQLQLNEQSAVNNGATISGAVSTVTIETMLGSSNGDLAAAHNTNNNINDEHTV